MTLSVYAFLHCSIALAFGHQFLTVEACVLYGEGHVVFVVDSVALGQDFLSVLQFHTSLLCIVVFGRRSLDSLEAEVLTDIASSYFTSKEKCPSCNKFHIHIINR